MDLDNFLSVVVIGIVITLAITCLVAVWYVRKVDSERHEDSPYLDMLIARDTRCGIAAAIFLCLCAYTVGRAFWPNVVPTIGAGWVSVWIGSGIVLFIWGPIKDAVQFRRDRQVGPPRSG